MTFGIDFMRRNTNTLKLLFEKKFNISVLLYKHLMLFITKMFIYAFFDKEYYQTVKTIILHQTNPLVHHLTCGKNPNHRLLNPVINKSGVSLNCPDCDYKQNVTGGLISTLTTGNKS
jgi:hypothetical protein